MNLKELLRKLETEEVEFKESLKLKDDIGRTISSFSNSDGGAILVGVTNSGEVVGVSIGQNTIEELANYIKRNTDPKIFPSIGIEEVDKKKIIVIKVRESDVKPVFFKKHGFKRVGRTNLELTSSEIRKLAREEKKRLKWDERICERATLDDIDVDVVRQFLITAKRERNLDMSRGAVARVSSFPARTTSCCPTARRLPSAGHSNRRPCVLAARYLDTAGGMLPVRRTANAAERCRSPETAASLPATGRALRCSSRPCGSRSSLPRDSATGPSPCCATRTTGHR